MTFVRDYEKGWGNQCHRLGWIKNHLGEQRKSIEGGKETGSEDYSQPADGVLLEVL